MRSIFIFIFLLCFVAIHAQKKADTIQLVQKTARLYDLEFTEAEADSLLGNLYSNMQLYKGMHKSMLSNSVPFPFAFNPVPNGMDFNKPMQSTSLPVRSDIQMPANKNNLAFFYSINNIWCNGFCSRVIQNTGNEI